MVKVENKKFEIEIDSWLDEKTIDIIKRYWQFDGTKFKERIGQIGKDHGICYTKLLPIIKKHSKAIVFDFCHDCDELMRFEARSQSSFLAFFNVINMCADCLKIREEKFEKKKFPDSTRSILDRITKQRWNRNTINLKQRK